MERPQDKNLVPLGSGKRTPEEEREIHVKGARAANVTRRRNAEIRSAVRALCNTSVKGKGRSMSLDRITSVEQIQEGTNIPIIMRLVYSQFERALEGDKEARDWICKMLGIDDSPQISASGMNLEANSETGSVRIHLIRGEKTVEQMSEEETATQVEGESL